jgi:hypothetical protein
MSMSSDDEAPETFSFTTSRKTAKEEGRVLTDFHAHEKKKLKDRRRERDRALKERKHGQAPNRELGSGKNDKGKKRLVASDEIRESHSRSELEARMERAMKEAEQESDEEEDMGRRDQERSSESSMQGIQADKAELQGALDEDQELNSDESEDDEERPTFSKQSKADYLPDHLFSAAFVNPPSSSAKLKGKPGMEASPSLSKKRRSAKRTPKDIIVRYVSPP